MVIYAFITGSGNNWVSTDSVLAQMGIASSLMAIFASFGLLGLCGISIPDICVIMPFLVLGKNYINMIILKTLHHIDVYFLSSPGVGMDDMGLLLSGWRHSFSRSHITNRADCSLRIVAISMTIMLMTDIMMFSVGATCPFHALQMMCAYSGLSYPHVKGFFLSVYDIF